MPLLVPPCALLALLLPVPPPAAPPASAPLHAEVLRRLDASLHASPQALPREQDWAPLGPEVLPELLALVTDARAAEPQRLHAVAALAVVASADVPQRLRALTRDPALSVPLRAAAMEALVRRTGLAALGVLTPLLTDPSGAVRASAAQALGHLGGPEARRALEEHLTREEQLEVREAIQQALSYLEP